MFFAKDYIAFQVFKRNKYVKHTPINTRCFQYIILKLYIQNSFITHGLGLPWVLNTSRSISATRLKGNKNKTWEVCWFAVSRCIRVILYIRPWKKVNMILKQTNVCIYIYIYIYLMYVSVAKAYSLLTRPRTDPLKGYKAMRL